MNSTSQILGIVAAGMTLLVVVELLRRRHLRERHAIWWFAAGLLALIAGIFPTTLEWAADLFGIAVPTNLIFFISIAVLFLVCLQHSSELTELESKTRDLAEQSGLLELRLRELEAIASRSASRDNDSGR
ncbi:DUF2304 domain-containing protein [Cryobacterium suzukii]|uniref:DUF2304 domain-containing protein n=1 Tax=Cryobacterium suzukii TaxID=1259198 RepID=A0A4R9AGG9_9MICO|nr:DUF2304 domain-containing protein [Cryobacterium suzukii]TFD61346.1 DUF2304 domain-containing protein [Cryobacterium suzukii]